MTRVLFVSSEPLRRQVAGIGLRYLEFARTARELGFRVTLSAPSPEADLAAHGLAGLDLWSFSKEALPKVLGAHDVVVAQGQLANDVVLAGREVPTVVDLFDPWLVENAVYLPTLGFEAFRNDLASWRLQMARGDLFLCSSEEQRLYYAGFLTALGRVHPERLRIDPTLEGLLRIVPYGLHEELPPHRPYLPEREPGERRILFGALYDWYDPWPLLGAVERLGGRWTLWFVRTANPDSTPQQTLRELEAARERNPDLARAVRVLPWVPAERRFDLLRDVDLLVAPTRPGLEADLAWRTRFLEALAAGCPVLLAKGGSFARLLESSGATGAYAAGNAEELASAIEEAMRPEVRAARVRAGRELAQRFTWRRIFEPVVPFLSEPRVDPWKERIEIEAQGVKVIEPLGAQLLRRVRRRLRRW